MVEKVILAKPRGFCAGVARSIKVVEDCISLFSAPVYVKHAIVHNTTVVADLEKIGAITVENVDDVREGAVVVFSAHGSPPEHYDAARARRLTVIDATCPLVTKVHIEIARYIRDGYSVVYVGHRGHVEGIGVRGEAAKVGVTVPLVDNLSEVNTLAYPEDAKIAILTQTTLSVDETSDIIAAIRKKYKNAVEPPTKDICYATTNRQGAVKELANVADVILVVGSKTSSNSNRLVQVAREKGIAAYLIDGVGDIASEMYENKKIVGISAGASAPEKNVQEVVRHFTDEGSLVEELEVLKEQMHFTPPPELSRIMKEKRGA